MSAEHAAVFWSGERWELRDLGSSNGTFVEGRRAAHGERILLKEGVRMSFGSDADRWVLVDALPPVASARRVGRVGGEAVQVAEKGLLALPGADDPEISIFEAEKGRWLVEAGGPARPAVDGETLTCSGSTWILSVPPPFPGGVVPTTHRDLGSPRLIGLLTLLFHVSRDGEYVKLALVHGAETIDMSARVHHEFLLTLARARLSAKEDASTPEAEKGWLYVDDVAAMLGVEPDRVNMAIYRSRQQFAESGVLNAGALFERRPTTRQIRLATDRVEIRPL
ncbi:FHA domain protein [Chondromyces apiculatus DSM 436]|uniref:FHA domain protein n=1 Tax=Chondromyces apiculatus DSM 436 TaxID=1192034 RepID=A0A017TEI4_9BACT|nr:FHA domain protein [Chondromyces apiculatus DSM 436]